MENSLRLLVKKILECEHLPECVDKNFLDQHRFCPDKPAIMTNDKKVMLVGINPGIGKDFSYEAYREKYYEKSIEERVEYSDSPDMTTRYSTTLSSATNMIVKKLIDKYCNITKENFYHHVYWANASFCPSKDTNRYAMHINFKNGEDPLKIYKSSIDDRVNRCSNKYLRNLINLVKPQLIIIASVNMMDVFNICIDAISQDGYEKNKESRSRKIEIARGETNAKIIKFVNKNSVNAPIKYIAAIPHPNAWLKGNDTYSKANPDRNSNGEIHWLPAMLDDILR